MNKSFPFGIRFPAAGATALFLDFDGTLVEFADHPDAVSLDPETHDCLGRLFERLNGALAIITGRDIVSVDRFLAPQIFPVAGVHGLLRRDADGRVHRLPLNDAALDRLVRELQAFAAQHDGLLVERKPGAVALHYRRRPEFGADCARLMDRLTAELGRVALLRGKAVIEARADGADKGSAIRSFLKESPFRGRCPLFAGDDATDEDGFAKVNALGGITIKVGPGPTCARYRVRTIADFQRWLCEMARHFEGQAAS